MKGVAGMNTNKNPKDVTKNPSEPYRFKKRLGSTTFHVNVHFNPNAKETAQDKIARLIRNDATFGKAENLWKKEWAAKENLQNGYG